MKVDLLKNHTHLLEEIAKQMFFEFGPLNPSKTLADFIVGLKKHCNDTHLPMTWVVLENGYFIGTFSLRQYDLASHADLSPWLGSVLVPLEHRNRGIGAFLVKQAEGMAQEMGFNLLYLFTPSKSSWYAKLGWETTSQSDLNKTPITIMQKSILSKSHD